MSSTNLALMACGCTGMATHNNAHDELPAGHPSCITHMDDPRACQVAMPTHLDGRQARCAYNCGATRPSSVNLAFFEYLGPGSPSSKEQCKCGYYECAHWPLWKADIKYARRWFKIERHEGIHSFKEHLPDRETAELWAAKQPDRWLNWTNDPETKVFEVELIGLHQLRNTLKCKQFEPRGPQEFDKFYCGCHGWD